MIVPTWKRKGDMHDTEKYMGITLLSQVMKLLERVLMIRRRVEGDFEEEQQGSRNGRGTANGMYVLRPMVEKILEVRLNVAQGVRRPGKKLLTQYSDIW